MLRVLVVGVTIALSTSAVAQDVMGLLNGTDTSFTSRGSSGPPNTNPSYAFVRIDQEHYAGWGYDASAPGMRTIQGIHVVLQDQIGNTPETFGITVYAEDAGLPDYPDINAPLGSLSGLPTPPSALTTPAVFDLLVTFATPVQAPAGVDVFPAVELPQPVGTTWPNDGLSIHALYYIGVSSTGTTASNYDLPGPAHPVSTQVGNGGYHVPVIGLGPTYTTTPRQWKIEPILGGAVGVAGTITNQASAPLSNAAPGTSSMASGLCPDARSNPLNSGRADDIVSRWFQSSAGTGTPVIFLLDIGNFGPEIPVSSIAPGSTGLSCLNLATAQVLGLAFTNAGEATFPITIPAATRSNLAGLSLLHQAAAFGPGGGAQANGCTKQVF